jgi:hypothetical protein
MLQHDSHHQNQLKQNHQLDHVVLQHLVRHFGQDPLHQKQQLCFLMSSLGDSFLGVRDFFAMV